MKPDQDLIRVVDFLNDIGIPTTFRPGTEGFLGRLRIEQGSLHVDPQCHVSDALHEAGHIAIVPKRYRHLLENNISKAQRIMIDDVRELLDDAVDHPLYRAVMQSGDPEATAWAWAAGVHLGIDPARIILDHQFEATGKFVRLQLQTRAYPGINGMAHAGFCAIGEALARISGLPCYPQLSSWTQEADFSSPEQRRVPSTQCRA